VNGFARWGDEDHPKNCPLCAEKTKKWGRTEKRGQKHAKGKIEEGGPHRSLETSWFGKKPGENWWKTKGMKKKRSGPHQGKNRGSSNGVQ